MIQEVENFQLSSKGDSLLYPSSHKYVAKTLSLTQSCLHISQSNIELLSTVFLVFHIDIEDNHKAAEYPCCCLGILIFFPPQDWLNFIKEFVYTAIIGGFCLISFENDSHFFAILKYIKLHN